MDQEYGKFVSSRYRIVFLPTLLVLDQNGNTKYKIDRLATANELLSIAKLTVDGYFVSKDKEEIPKEVFNQSSQKANKEEKDNGEKILYVLSPDAENLPPEILYQEAYFRMELMDGSHQATAEKYIQTQTNWFEEKNIQFIFDFLYDTNTQTFEFFIENKELFDRAIGKEKTDYSLEIIVKNRLNQGIPRPDFEEAKYLFSLIDSINYEAKAYQYYLHRTYEEDSDEFLVSAKNYLENIDTDDQEILIMFCTKSIELNESKDDIENCDKRLSKLKTAEKNYQYYATIAQLKYILLEKDDALRATNTAIGVAKQEKLDYSSMSQLLAKIKTL